VPEICPTVHRNPFGSASTTGHGDSTSGTSVRNDIEEVDRSFLAATTAELQGGTLFFSTSTATDAGFRQPGNRTAPARLQHAVHHPIAQYDTHHEGHSVIGGYIYRGSMIRAAGEVRLRDFSLLFKFPRGPTIRRSSA